MASVLKFDQWQNTAGVNYGTVLQVVSTAKVDSYVSSTQAWTTIPGLSVTITPKFSTSKILLMAFVKHGGENAWGGSHWRALRNGNVLTVTSVSGHQTLAHTGGLMYNSAHGLYDRQIIEYDSPGTTVATTYTIQGYPENDAGGGYIAVNTSMSPSTAYSSGGVSTIIAMEIAA